MSLSLPENVLPADRPQTVAFSQIAQSLTIAGIPFRFVAMGQSMYPTILNGEMLHVEPIGRQRLKSGDILLFRSNGAFKAHRVVRVEDDRFVTRGDASPQEDGVIDSAQILGWVVAKECRKTGRIVSLTGLIARLDFRLRRVRSRVGLMIRRFVGGNKLVPCSQPDRVDS